ncbi:hypothetical protein QBC42DRAFT_272248 [Cladorrhinum samala]|uniref:Uncharacterized protein n=1 Tax=Cladorrhinum samala TaxID=585594 RepID=A0AAV9HK23_9PEZI|nr:hypothetical protein QBC42DRAFT_272248 [Cladorrhinum samala]
MMRRQSLMYDILRGEFFFFLFFTFFSFSSGLGYIWMDQKKTWRFRFMHYFCLLGGGIWSLLFTVVGLVCCAHLVWLDYSI